MKHWTVALALMVGAAAARAQERFPDEQARKIGALFKEAADKKAKLPLKSAVDPAKAFGMYHQEHTALVMPDKNLSAAALAKAGKDVIPVGQLWMKRLAPMVEGELLPAEKLVMVAVTIDGQEHKVFLCQVGVRKGDKGMELVVLSKDDKPLVTVPLKEVDEKQELPLRFDATPEGEEGAVLSFAIAGKYRGKLTVGFAAP